MKKIFTFFVAFLSFGLLIATAQTDYIVKRGERPPIDLDALPDDAFEKGIIKIKLDESFTNHLDNNPVIVNDNGTVVFNIATIDDLNQQFGAKSFERVFEVTERPSKYSERHRAWGFHLWYALYFDEKADIIALVKAYEKLNAVTIASPKFKTQLSNSAPITFKIEKEDGDKGPLAPDWTPNDPSYNLQWHYHNTGQSGGTVDADIDLPEAWNIETGNSNVIVSVHDQGVQYNHPDLNGNMWINSDEIAGNGIDDDGNGYVDDIYGYDFYNNNGSIEAGYHGTHVAGTIAAESNNGAGVAGIAGGTGVNDGVRIMTCMVYLAAGGGGNGHEDAPIYAADNGACIDQNSWNYTSPNSYDPDVLDAIDYFNLNGGGTALSGGITIYSAGNNSSNSNYYPGCYSGTFAVASTNNQDIKAWYSNYGTWVDVSAPGGETDVVTARGVYSTYTTNTYGYLQGTSMACPHVSGTAALIVSYAFGQLTASEVADILRNTTDDIDGLNPTYAGQLGTGRLNAYQALLETENYLGTPGLWTGTVSTDWYNGSNWDDGNVPTSTTSVTIQAGTPFSPVIGAGNAYCLNLFLQSGATLVQNTSSYFWCYDYFDAGFGQFTMNGTSYLYLSGNGNSDWWDDNQNDTYTNVRIEKTLSTAQTLMRYNITCTGNFEIREGVLAISSGRTLTVNNTGSTAFEIEDGGKLILDSSTEGINVAGSIRFFNGSQATLSNGSITCGGNFTVDANASYDIAFTGGTLIMNGSSSQYINDLDGGNLDLDNLTIAKTGGVCYIQSANLDVNDGLLISGGTLSCNNGPTPTATYNINVAGNWTNNVGPGGFIESTGRVIFDGGNYHQYCSNETFNILEINKPSGGAFRVDAGTVICAQYDWTAGAVDVNTGTFTTNDLADNGLFGAYYLNPGGTINITNSGTGTYVDLRGELHIFGGTMNVSGSISEWPYLGNAVLEMSDGILDFKTCGIIVSSNSYTLTDNITGGIIRTAYGFSGNRADFTPGAGTFEFYGSGDSYISQSNGCTLYNVNINKSSKDGSINKPEFAESGERIDMTGLKGGKANSISLSSNFTINNNLTINAGSFVLNGYQATVANIVDVYGSLVMNNALDVLYAGTGSYDNLTFYNGSNSSLTAGSIYPASWLWSQAGATITGTSGNTIYFTGSNTSGIEVDGPGSVFGNVDINKSGGPMYLFCYASPAELAGYFNIHAANSIQMQGSSMIVHGIVTDNATSAIHLDFADKGSNPQVINADKESMTSVNGAKGGYLEIDPAFTLNGLLNVYDGNVLVHGLFNIAASGTLTITTGSLICDAPSTSVAYVAGNFNLGEGLFEIRNNGLNMGPATSSITGGLIKAGGSFIANAADKFKPAFGTVELINGVNGHYIQMHSTNYFNHLIVNRAYPIGIYSGTSLTIKKDLTINAGGLNSNNLPVYLGGNWNENMGPAGFGEGTGTVFFNGVGAVPFGNQYITGNETFYNIENAKSGGGNLFFDGDIDITNNFLANDENIVNGPSLDVNNLLLSTGILGLTTGAPNVTVNNFTMGGYLSVTDGNFTCNDVVNNGIFGTITMYNGSITLFQDAGQYPDLNATVNISGGYMAVNGGNGGSYWGYGSPCNITMSNGVLDFNNNGIYMDNAYPVTENISGGTIKTNLSFYTSHVNFTPSGGTVEMYGGTDAVLGVFNNSNLFNLLINKSGGDKEFSFETLTSAKQTPMDSESQSGSELFSAKKSDRPDFPVSESKANSISTSNIVKVNGTTTIEEGTLLVDNYQTTCMNNIVVNSGGKLAMGDYGTLAIETGKSLTINNGGSLDMVGSVSGAATITHNTGYYALNVESGGTIGAVYGVFEYMNTNGVNIKNGAVVDVVKPFNNCTFRNGQSGGRLMSIENNQVFNVNDAIFPANSWSGTYNVYKNVNAGTVNFMNATGAFAGEGFDFDPNNRINWTVPAQIYNFTVFLEGPFDPASNKMKTDINSILPTGQPYYPSLPYFGNPMPDWYYGGTETVGAIPNIFIVDWVVVQLREGLTPGTATTILATQAAFINNIGQVVGMDGLNPITFAVSYSTNLYVVIWHRNHLGIISANALVNVGGVFTYDFSSGSGQALGGTSAQKQLAPGIWGMMSGDGDGSGGVATQDCDLVWDIQAGTTGYKAGDYNMNRQVNNPDKDDKWLPNLGKGSFIP